jgi:hypothetical protein
MLHVMIACHDHLNTFQRYAWLYTTRSQPAMHSCLVRIDNVDKRRLQASAANKEAIDVGLLRELIAVLLRHAAAVQDARLLCRLRRHLLGHPLADCLVNLLCLLGGSDLAGSDGPVVR